MKKFILFVLFASLPFLKCISQDSTLSLSKFEEFYGKTGIMTRTDQGKIGEILDLNVYLSRVTDLSTGDTLKAVNIVQNSSIFLSSINFGLLYIDFDEIPGVIKALEYYIQQIQQGKPKHNPYYEFVTSNDVLVGCSYNDAGLYSGWNVALSKRYKYFRATVPSSKKLFKIL